MFANLVVIFVTFVVAGLFALLAAWAARSPRALVKWPGLVLGGLLAVVFLLAAGVMGRGVYLLYAPRSIPAADVVVEVTPARVARGEYLAQTVCAACHTPDGETLPLTGGKNISDDTGMPLGDLYPPNLTPAGDIANWTDGEILRAIREGTHKSGRPLAVMPVVRLRNLSDEDAYAIVAYLRSQPAIEGRVPGLAYSPLTLILVGTGIVPIGAAALPGPVASLDKAPTAEYGAYVISYVDCRDCHGEQLDGVVPPPAPPGPNLALVKGWTAEQFIATLRTGVDPSGHELQPPMPWRTYGKMDDTELTAMYLYLQEFFSVAATAQ